MPHVIHNDGHDLAEPRSDGYLTITLRDLTDGEPLPVRTLFLGNGTWTAKIGRGSQSEVSIRPAYDNALFLSKVMSRQHAIIRADPVTKRITLEDVGSMHGTYVNETRLQDGDDQVLLGDDIIKFGLDIVRGDTTYDALRLSTHYEWSDKNPFTDVTQAVVDRRQNNFSADYSEDENTSEDDHEVTPVSGLQEQVETIHEARTYTVPEPDSSEYDSEAENQSRSPSPPAEDHLYASKNIPSHIQLDDTSIVDVTTDASVNHASRCDSERHEQVRSEDQPAVEEQLYNPRSDLETAQQNQHAMISLPSIRDTLNTLSDSYESIYGLSSFQPAQSCQPCYAYSPPAMPQEWYGRGDLATSNSNVYGQAESDTSFGRAGPNHWHTNPIIDHQPLAHDQKASIDGFPDQEDIEQGWSNSHNGNVRVAVEGPPRPPKVAIHDMLHERKLRTPFSKMSRKRKATDMIEAENDQLEESSASPLPDKTTSNDVPSINGSNEASDIGITSDTLANSKHEPVEVDTVVNLDRTFHSTRAAPVIEAAIIADTYTMEPARKKTKVDNAAAAHKASSSRTVLRYTATALAGAAIGAVSTVIGLAALPADFFA